MDKGMRVSDFKDAKSAFPLGSEVDKRQLRVVMMMKSRNAVIHLRGG